MLFSDIFNPRSYVPDSEKIYQRINGMDLFKSSFNVYASTGEEANRDFL